MDPTNLKPRPTPHWDLYRRDKFVEGTRDYNPPGFNTHPEELEKLAKERLTNTGWSYASANAGLGTTHDANRSAFSDWQIVPRMCVDTDARDTRVEIFGKMLPSPIAISPIGINKIYHGEGELPVARVAGELGMPYSLSTAGSASLEDVATHNAQGAAHGLQSHSGATDPNGLRWFQLYLSPHDLELSSSLLRRAHEAGFEACLITLDTPQLAWRHKDVAEAAYGFYKGMGTEIALSDPVFLKRLEQLGIDPAKDPKAVGRAWIDSVWHGKSYTWETVAWAKDEWKKISGGKPFLTKGIQTVYDAKKSLEIGCDGIVVSNHAGRQVDGAIGSLTVLPEIVKAVGDKMTIAFDSGIRGGADVFKALALGADLVMIGRLWIFGLSVQGEEGVRHVLKSLLAEFDLTMHTAGFRNIKEIDGSALRHKSEVGSRL